MTVLSLVWSSMMTMNPLRAYRRTTQKKRARVLSLGKYALQVPDAPGASVPAGSAGSRMLLQLYPAAKAMRASAQQRLWLTCA